MDGDPVWLQTFTGPFKEILPYKSHALLPNWNVAGQRQNQFYTA